MNSIEEQWRPVNGYRDYTGYYEVSNLGRIRSLDRYVRANNNGFRLSKSSVMTPKQRKDGYCQVSLSKKGTQQKLLVHTLVAFAWLEPCPGTYGKRKGCYIVEHRDRNRSNNIIKNLEWLLFEKNSEQGAQQGEQSSLALLKNADVIAIRNSDLSYKELAEIYNVDYQTMLNIIQGHKWQHLDYPNKEEQIKKRKKGSFKLSQDQILAILMDTRTQVEIGKEYGIHSTTVHNIKKNPKKYLKD